MPGLRNEPEPSTSVLVNEHTPRTTRSASALRTDQFLAPGTRVERYVLAERLGAGGMGVVYKAYDTQLSRHVALKFLHHGAIDLDLLARADVYRDRLLREAQALAKLSHPNVVALFDVGEHQGSVFLAMELIEGVSLSAWVRERRNQKQEVLRALIDAGRGLAAAHRAGVLHRDFKLGNVMVSAGGRVRVLDFGLARAAETMGSEEHPAHEHDASPSGLVSLSSELTQAGTVLGTIGYIAPESFLRSTVDERSDQFSYAESVFVALTGHHSFESHSTETYRAALLEGRRARWPRGTSRRIRRVVERGQSFEPAERHESMDAMVQALERAARPSRTWVAAAVAMPIAALGIAAWERWPASCAVAPDALAGVWDPEVRREVEQGFSSSGKSYAEDSFRRVSAQFDGWSTRWQEMKVEACRATRVRREQSERVFSLRNACLDGKRTQLGVLVSLFRRADPAVVDRAAGAAHEVALLAECDDVPRLLGESDRMPDDPARRTQIEALDTELNAIDAWLQAGRLQESLERSQRAVARAEQLEFLPVLARAHARLSNVISWIAPYEDAAAARLRAFKLAVEARTAPLIAVLSTRMLNDLIDQSRFPEAEAMMPLVAANIELAGDPVLRLRLLTNRSVVLVSQRRYDEARAQLDEAQAECLKQSEATQRVCFVVGQGLANLYTVLRELPAAQQEFRRLVAAKQEYYGPRHPLVALEYTNLAEVALLAGDAEGARAAIAAAEGTGQATKDTAVRLQLVAAGLLELAGDCAGAVEAFTAAQPAVDAMLGPESGEAALAALKIAQCRMRQGQPRAALAPLEQAVKIRRAAGTPDLPEALFALAQATVAVGERERAEATAREALTLWREQGPLWAEETRSVEAWLATRR